MSYPTLERILWATVVFLAMVLCVSWVKAADYSPCAHYIVAKTACYGVASLASEKERAIGYRVGMAFVTAATIQDKYFDLHPVGKKSRKWRRGDTWDVFATLLGFVPWPTIRF